MKDRPRGDAGRHARFFRLLPDRFVLAFIVNDWNLTYGQSGMILLASGISAPFGSLVYGWLADKIGRRKVMIATVLNFSLATGAMALTPDGAWIYLVVCRFIVGLRRDRSLLGRYHAGAGIRADRQARLADRPHHDDAAGGRAARRVARWLRNALYRLARAVCGRTAAGGADALHPCLGAESPHWLMRMGRPEEARRSIAWALQVDPESIPLPTASPVVEHTRWIELFKYPRSLIAGCLTGLTQTGGVALGLWMVTLFVMVLHVSPAEASKLVIWVSLSAVAGRFFCSWISDAMGRRASGVLSCLIAALFMSLAGYLNSVFIGGVSMFFLMIVLQSFFGSGNYSIVGP